jgi:hypothetical protein
MGGTPARDARAERRDALRRWLRIGARSAHILTSSVLFGGHVFAVGADLLKPWLYAALATGVVLWSTDLGQGLGYLREVRAVTVMVKIALVAAVALYWDARVALLAVVVLLSGVVSHMPGRYRYWVVGRGPRDEQAPEIRSGLG